MDPHAHAGMCNIPELKLCYHDLIFVNSSVPLFYLQRKLCSKLLSAGIAGPRSPLATNRVPLTNNRAFSLHSTVQVLCDVTLCICILCSVKSFVTARPVGPGLFDTRII
jgi:hypothetical protein